MFESYLSLIIAATLLLGSPGPVPLSLAAIGATHGIKAGALFLLGILSGLVVAILGASLGLAALFGAFPAIKLVCQALGAIYIGYLAYKIATAPVNNNQDPSSVPAFRDGFVLNIINPKAYAAFLAIFSQFLLPFEHIALSYVITGLCCFLVAVVVDSLWLCAGGFLKPVFASPVSARLIRWVFALLMLVSVVYVNTRSIMG